MRTAEVANGGLNGAGLPRHLGKYRCLVIDPPWQQGKTGKRSVRPNQGIALDYPTMAFGDIKALPVPEWAAEESYLWLWATNSKDRQTKEPVVKMAFDLLEHWGYTFNTMLTWDKKTGPCPFGPYQIVSEYALFAWRGAARFEREHLGRMKTVFSETSRGHSIKPRGLYEHIRKTFPGPRLDVFARQKHPGFDGWGNEYAG